MSRARCLFLPVFLAAALLFGPMSSGLHAVTIVADHTVVAHYADIPQEYIDKVKKMWATVPGESHSSGYRIGLNILASQDSRFAVGVLESGTPEAYTDTHLRFSRASWGDVGSSSGWIYGYGEEDWYTSTTAVDRTKASLTYCNTGGRSLAATGFGWCWDTTWQNSPGGTVDPVYKVRWAGSSVGGPDGNKIWGLDADDYALTGNHVCMDTYLQATQTYIDFCKAQGYPTVVFFTTGPIEGASGESAYQRHLKHQRIRDYVQNGTDLYLFDYADILSWSDAGEASTLSWTDSGGTPHTFANMHSDNMKDLDGTYTEDGDHIGKRGSLRLGKAMWWLLARIAGWDGNPVQQHVTVTAPNGGESWALGHSRSIQWTQTGLTGDVTLELLRSGSPVQTLGTAAASAGTFSWTPAGSLAQATDYTIRISLGAVSDVSDASFALYMEGDVNGDGNVDAGDVGLLAGYLAGNPVSLSLVAADTNESGDLDVTDLLLLQVAATL